MKTEKTDEYLISEMLRLADRYAPLYADAQDKWRRWDVQRRKVWAICEASRVNESVYEKERDIRDELEAESNEATERFLTVHNKKRDIERILTNRGENSWKRVDDSKSRGTIRV